MTWRKGRELASCAGFEYRYNQDGIRIEKRDNYTIYQYVLDGTNILKETVTDNCCNCTGYVNEYLYDLDGTVCGIKHNETAYYFYKNLQGDVIAITNDSGEIVAKYSYDAWGKCTVESDTSGVGIANINPFRYRSYYYDAEIGMYYLQSRYYDPEVGRFINADNIYNIPQNDDFFIGLYKYCTNCPVMKVDPNGEESDYINNQEDSSWKSVAVGFLGNVHDNGCGAIAVYNILHAYSSKITLKSVLRGLRLFYGSIIYNNIGKLGISPISIFNYLRVRFFFVYSAGPITLLWNVKAKGSGAVIVLYANKGWDGLHYVAGIKRKDKFTFYNCNYSETTESFTMKEYLQRLKKEKAIPLYMICVAKKIGWW